MLWIGQNEARAARIRLNDYLSLEKKVIDI